MERIDSERMKEKIRKVVEERDWAKYHTPKNIAIALSLEASELLEIFLWMKEEEKLSPEKLDKIKDEIADVFYWVLRLSDCLDIDLNTVFWDKMKKNEAKYPIHLSKGNSKKYTELKD